MNVNIAKKILTQVNAITNEYCTIEETVTKSEGTIDNNINLYIANISLDDNAQYSGYTRYYAKTLKAIDIFVDKYLKDYKRITKD